MKIRLPYPPSANNLYPTRRGRRVLSERGRQYRETAARMAASQGVRPIRNGDVTVSIMLYRPRRIGDVDDCLKIILDSLTDIAWTDDKQVRRIIAERDDDPADPRAMVEVQPYRRE